MEHKPLRQDGSDGSLSWYTMFGEVDKNLTLHGFPSWFFPGVLRMDFSETIRSQNISAQRFTCVPRHWFIDAYFCCEKCKKEFCWTAQEQRHWFDDLHFWVGAYPELCPQCSKIRRTIFRLDNYYGTNIQTAIRRDAPLELKRQMLDALDELERLSEKPISSKKLEHRETLKKQIAKALGLPLQEPQKETLFPAPAFRDFLPSAEFPAKLSTRKEHN